MTVRRGSRCGAKTRIGHGATGGLWLSNRSGWSQSRARSHTSRYGPASSSVRGRLAPQASLNFPAQSLPQPGEFRREPKPRSQLWGGRSRRARAHVHRRVPRYFAPHAHCLRQPILSDDLLFSCMWSAHYCSGPARAGQCPSGLPVRGVTLGRSHLKWGDCRLKAICIELFGAQGAGHQTP